MCIVLRTSLYRHMHTNTSVWGYTSPTTTPKISPLLTVKTLKKVAQHQYLIYSTLIFKRISKKIFANLPSWTIGCFWKTYILMYPILMLNFWYLSNTNRVTIDFYHKVIHLSKIAVLLTEVVSCVGLKSG